MNSFEYAMVLISIVLGLAIGDLATSFHKLYRHKATVRWDSRVVLAVALTFLTIFNMWFAFWNIRDRIDILSYLFMLSFVVELVFLYLMSRSVLPEEPKTDADLGSFYQMNSRDTWSFYSMYFVIWLAHWTYFQATQADFRPQTMIVALPIACAPLIAALAMAVWPKRRLLHLSLTSLLIAFSLFVFMDDTLSADQWSMG